jgi:transcriptional regulator with XRE-family HTH domain
MKKTDNTWVADLETSREGRRLLERERVYVEATENLASLMEAEGVSRADLARRLEVSRATVTQMLAGNRNLTLGTLSDAFLALNRSLHVSYGPLTNEVQLVPAEASCFVHAGAMTWDAVSAAVFMTWSASCMEAYPRTKEHEELREGTGIAA